MNIASQISSRVTSARRRTSTPTTTAPKTTGTPKPSDAAPADPVCKLDSYGEYDGSVFLASLRALLKSNFGASDNDIDAMVAEAGGRAGSFLESVGARAFGDVSQCAAVRTNRVVTIVQLVVMGLTVPVMMAAMVPPRGVPMSWPAMWALSTVGLGLTAFQLRHTLSLAAKVVWNSSGPATRAMLVLSAVTAALGSVLGYLRDAAPWPAVVIALAALAGATVAKMVFVGRQVANPEASYALALVSALDRIITNERLSSARKAVA